MFWAKHAHTRTHVREDGPCRVTESMWLTGGIASEMAAAKAQACAPEFEARVGHALPLSAHLVGSSSESVIAHIPVSG